MQAVRKKKTFMMHIKDTIYKVISYKFKQTTLKYEYTRICYECLTSFCCDKELPLVLTKFCCKSLRFECSLIA